MRYIPILRKPYPDELLYSWIGRLAKMNGVSLSGFGHMFLNIKKADKYTLPSDVRAGFVPLYKHILNPGDMAETYLSLSTFLFESIAMTPRQQTRYINNVFRPTDALNHAVTTLFQKIRICPECVKEDTEKFGEPYIHRVHQLSGMHICPKHHIALHIYTGNPLHEIDFNLDSFKKIQEIPEGSSAYADYACTLHESGICSDVISVKDVILQRYKELGYKIYDGYNALIKDLNEWRYGSLWNAYGSEQFLRVNLIKSRNVNMTELVVLLMFLFPDINDLLSILDEHEPVLEQYMCPVCGEIYCATPQSVRDGWGCPNCWKDIPERDRFARLIEVIGNGEYKLLGTFTSMTERIPMIHSCGKELSIAPENFLYRGSRCSCEAKYAAFDPQKEIESHPGFKLIKFNGSHSKATILHEKCGQEFECMYYKFLDAPRCRICDPTRYTQETFKQAIKDRVGDEYSLTGKYDGLSRRVSIRHNKCGHEQSFIAKNFIDGQRCEKCTPRPLSTNLQEALDEYSKRRYIITEKGKKNKIYDNVSGKTIVLKTATILQEINRPTPSPLLPLNVTESEKKGVAKSD